MVEKIQSLFKKEMVEVQPKPKIKASAVKDTSDFMPMGTWGGKEPPPMTTSEQLKAYRSWVYAAVSMKSQSVASMELTLYKKTRKGVDVVEEHPVLELLDKVNERMTFYGLMNYSSMIQNLTGECYWLLIRNSRGEPVEIYPWLRPDYMTVIPSKTKGTFIEGYIYKVPGSQKEVPLSTDEVIQFMNPNPTNPYRGISPVGAVGYAIETDKKASAWNYLFYKNNASPRGILKIQNRFDEAQYKQLKASWDAGHKGEGNENKVAIIFTGSAGTDADFMEVGMSNKDMDFLKQREFSRDEILSIFGVPYSLLNPGHTVNRSTVEGAQVNYLTNTIKPEIRQRVEELNEFLIPKYRNSEGLFFDFIDPVPANREQEVKTYDNGIRNGWLTVDEVREKEGLPPLTEEQKPKEPVVAPTTDEDTSTEDDITEDETSDNEMESTDETPDESKSLNRKKFNVRIKSTSKEAKIKSIVDSATSVKLKELLVKQKESTQPKKIIIKKVKTNQKEKVFQKNINNQEIFLQKFYTDNFEKEVIKTEKEIQDYLVKKYSKAPSEIVNGVKVFKQNDRLRKEMEEWVDNKMKKLQKYFEGDKMKEIHKTSEDNAKLTLKEMKAVDKGIVSNMTTFLHGYRSNIEGFIFNEGRRISERITDNLLQAVAIALALEQARQAKSNRNTLKLSTVSHPRGLYRKTIADSADNDGISYFKMLVPIAALTALSEVGMTIAVLYMIKTQMEWDSYIDPNNNTNVVGGLGLHHGSQDYYLPIGFEELIDEKEISKQQRGELNSKGINNEDKNIYIKEIEETKEELAKKYIESKQQIEKEYADKEKESQELITTKLKKVENESKKLENEKKELEEHEKETEQKEKKLENLISKLENG